MQAILHVLTVICLLVKRWALQKQMNQLRYCSKGRLNWVKGAIILEGHIWAPSGEY